MTAERWRTGFDIDGRRAGMAPLIGVPIGGFGVAVNAALDDGDLRVGVLPWTLTFAAASLAVCSLGLLAAHDPSPNRRTIVGGWWTALAFCGVAAFFLALAVGGALGIDEDDAGVAIVPPLLAMMFGAASMTPATGMLASGIGSAKRLPARARRAAWVATPVMPLLLLVGITEGAVETIASGALIGALGLAWITMGASLFSQSRPGGTDRPSVPRP